MTLTWAMLLLIMHPEVLKNAIKELDAVIGNERRQSWNDRIHLPYIDAILHEVQRYADIIPIGIAHGSKGNNSIIHPNFL